MSEPIPSCPVLCLRLGTPRRCCTSRILSCNGLVHALFLQSLVPPFSPSFLIVLSTTEAPCCNGGERHFLKLSVCLSLFLVLIFQKIFIEKITFRQKASSDLSLSLIHDRVLWQEINQDRGYGFGAQLFFFVFFFNFVKQWRCERSPQRQAISNSPNNSRLVRGFQPAARVNPHARTAKRQS